MIVLFLAVGVQTIRGVGLALIYSQEQAGENK
jgi:hypothetical protein